MKKIYKNALVISSVLWGIFGYTLKKDFFNISGDSFYLTHFICVLDLIFHIIFHF